MTGMPLEAVVVDVVERVWDEIQGEREGQIVNK